MSSSVHFDNKGRGILMIGEGSTQKLYDTTLTAEDIYILLILHNQIKGLY